MISLDDARKIVNQEFYRLPSRKVRLKECLGSILAEDILSPIDLPPFDKSAMDGIAIRADESGRRLQVVETIAAGKKPEKSLEPGECSRIMTGGMLPAGAQRVIPRELIREEKGWIEILEDDSNRNVSPRGEDSRAGDLVLAKGTLVRPAEMAVLSTVGKESFQVSCLPQVGILCTGSEIVEPGESRNFSQIFNANAYSLMGQIRQAGFLPVYFGIVPDELKNMKKAIREALSNCHALLISGSVSMGDFDYIPQVLKDLKVRVYFHQVAIKPGKPTLFGIKGEQAVFGLPGNPVSTMIAFELLVKPLLYRMMGHEYRPVIISSPLQQAIHLKNNQRTTLLPVILRSDAVESIEFHGSADVRAMSRATALLEIPAGSPDLLAGEIVRARLL